MGPLSILVVEDHAALRAALGELLRVAFPDYAVHECADAAAAMAAALRHPPATAVIDVSLPDLGGHELVAQLCLAYPGLRPVVISQHPPSVHAPRALAAGAFAFVPKDRLREDLVATMTRALATGDAHGA